MQKLSPERMRPIRDEVYDILRQAILDGTYRPGDKLKEEELALRLGVSRTPVREALRKLEMGSYVKPHSHRSVVVSPVDPDEVEDLLEVRREVEVRLIRKAAVHATPEGIAKLRRLLGEADGAEELSVRLERVEAFNALMLGLSQSGQLLLLHKKVREMLQRVLVSGHADPARARVAVREHAAIVDALEAKDPDLAEARLREHLSDSRRFLKLRRQEEKGESSC